MINLPEQFLERMKVMLGENFPTFLQSYDNPQHHGLRLNTNKNTDHILPLLDSPIPWADNGYYYTKELGKMIFFNMGLYYIQEPSAMLPAEVLAPNKDDIVLDLCAAPGGKTTQLAGKCKLLISNEIIQKRALILKDNVSRMGYTNTIVLNETPENIAKTFDGYFDKVLVDAPCSGEGMFRKNPEAINEWSIENVKMCATRQLDILNTIKNCVKENGIIVYSTCTFSPEEDEQVIEKFLEQNPDFKLLDIDNKYFSKGLVYNTANNFTDIEKTVRIFPHLTKGEGHFIAKLIKTSPSNPYAIQLQKSVINSRFLSLFKEFEKKYLNTEFKGTFLQFGENIYIVSSVTPNLKKLKVTYSGLLLGSINNNRFEPSHEMALALKDSDCKNTLELTDSQMAEYIKGNVLNVDSDLNGWILLTYQNNPLSWGKISNGQIKNHYPKYLRQ